MAPPSGKERAKAFEGAAAKVVWSARGASMMALVLGVATMAHAAVTGNPLRLGQTNTVDALSGAPSGSPRRA